MNTRNEAAVGIAANGVRHDLEALFDAHYERIARVIARVIRDPGRAEELAVEVFLKWPPGSAEGWLYRTAVRAALDELRRQARRHRYEKLLALLRPPPTPEQLHSSNQQQDHVRTVLAALHPRQAEMLLLRGEGLNYSEIASALDLNPASVGTLLSRAQQVFRKEYVKRYGEQ